MSFTLNYNQSGFSQQEAADTAQELLSSQDELRKINFFQKEPVSGTSYPRLILIGIGGASLGARAVIESLRPDMSVTYLDMIDPRTLEETLASLEKDEYGVIVVSKSGQTLETLVNFGVLASQMKRCTIVADEGTPLASFAQKYSCDYQASPKELSGRFSLFTAVGRVPLAGAGIDTEKFCAGAEKMRIACLGSDAISNPALYGAAMAYLHLQKGRSLHSIFHADSRLRGLSYWWQQILAESLGKEGKGITPLVNDPTDLHALFQRYAQGPQDVYTTFITVDDEESSVSLSDDFSLLPQLAGKKVSIITANLINGVTNTYTKLKLPWVHVHLESLNEETLGAFCMWKMMETIYLAKFLGVDAFSQPAVELYKSEIKKVLNS